jgi:hypothetical protein
MRSGAESSDGGRSRHLRVELTNWRGAVEHLCHCHSMPQELDAVDTVTIPRHTDAHATVAIVRIKQRRLRIE